MAAKTDAIEFEKRVRQVVKWILDGYHTADIIKTCVVQWEPLTERQAYNYLRKAKEQLKTHTDQELADNIAFHIAARKELFRGIPDKTQPYNAQVSLMILQDMGKIQDVYPKSLPTKLPKPGDGEPPAQGQTFDVELDL